MNKLKTNQKEYQNLSLFVNSIIEEKQIFHHIKKTGKSLKKNNKSIALNILYEPRSTEEIKHAYKSKYNKEHENQVTLLMITMVKKNGIILL